MSTRRRAGPSGIGDVAHQGLSRRERQIMDVLYRLGEATVAEVVAALEEGVSYDSIRVILGILREKGYVTHRREGPRYVHRPVVPHDRAARSAVRHLVRTYFRGSPTKAVLGLLDLEGEELSERELAEIEAWIAEAREGER
jgi:BlaI family transcriptional regulator, penicillinase repressor